MVNSSEQAITQTLAWYHFQFRLPGEWEPTGYVANPDKGRLEYSTRRGLEAQIYWRKCDRVPDVNRIMDEIHRRHLTAVTAQHTDTFRTLNRAKHGKFAFGWDRLDQPCHAALYLEESKILLQWLFPSYQQALIDSVVHPVLSSFVANDGELLRWAIFGLDLQLPRRFTLTQVSAYPANVSLTFEAKRGRVIARRWGLSPLLLAERSLRQFYRSSFAGNCRADTGAQIESPGTAGNPAVTVQFRQRGEHALEKMTGRWWAGRAIAWHDPKEMRIYAIEQVGPRKQEWLEWRDVFAKS